MTTLSISALKYAAPESPRPRPLRWIAVGLIAAILASAWWWGPIAIERARLIALQRACLRHVALPGQISYADAGLIGAHPHRAVPGEWSDLAGAMNAGAITPAGAAFVGQRLDPSGKRLLVVVETLDPRPAGLVRVLDCRVRVVAPSTFGPPRIVRDEMILGAAEFPADAKLRVFAGRPDPSDPAHFTIAYQAEGVPAKTLDGYLSLDDRVLLQARP